MYFTDVETKIRLLENEKKKMREEFDSQRAKLKELFLQKEGSFSLLHYHNAYTCRHQICR